MRWRRLTRRTNHLLLNKSLLLLTSCDAATSDNTTYGVYARHTPHAELLTWHSFAEEGHSEFPRHDNSSKGLSPTPLLHGKKKKNNNSKKRCSSLQRHPSASSSSSLAVMPKSTTRTFGRSLRHPRVPTRRMSHLTWSSRQLTSTQFEGPGHSKIYIHSICR